LHALEGRLGGRFGVSDNAELFYRVEIRHSSKGAKEALEFVHAAVVLDLHVGQIEVAAKSLEEVSPIVTLDQ